MNNRHHSEQQRLFKTYGSLSGRFPAVIHIPKPYIEPQTDYGAPDEVRELAHKLIVTSAARVAISTLLIESSKARVEQTRPN